jgi:aminoglycoside phosphotransferase (APT) family kinase protein
VGQPDPEADPEIAAALADLGLAPRDKAPRMSRLAGGVSSDVFRVDLADGPVCVKRALEQLRVAGDWRAPLERSDYEVEWLRVAADVPGVTAPEVIAHDPARRLFVMSWFDGEAHPVWKAELAAGRVDLGFAAGVGGALGRLHAATAGDPAQALRFDTGHLFRALRIDPYFGATAEAHPDLAPWLLTLGETTLETRRALVHGDFSPKNILVGEAPIVLDAECAWYGDPAFDLAFLSTHLLLKPLWRPAFATAFAQALAVAQAAYFTRADFEPREALEARAAALTAALLLARVDGKSPVEYLDEPARREARRRARGLILDPAPTLAALSDRWAHPCGGT